MTDLIVIQPQVTELTVTEDVNQVVVSSVGVQGPKGDTGATGATGPSGVVSVTAPITNSGTSTSANIGVSAGSTSAAGVLQLTDSISSTSTTTAATPNAVKTAYDLAALQNPVLKYQTGLYVRTPANQQTGATAVNQTVYYTPIYVAVTSSFDRIAIRTAGTFSGTASVRLGIFNDSSGLPSTVILDAGTVSCTAANTTYEITINQSLNAGFYWLAFCQQSAPTTASYNGATSAGSSFLNNYILTQANPSAAGTNAFTQTGVSGAFSTATSLSASTSAMFAWLRAA